MRRMRRRGCARVCHVASSQTPTLPERGACPPCRVGTSAPPVWGFGAWAMSENRPGFPRPRRSEMCGTPQRRRSCEQVQHRALSERRLLPLRQANGCCLGASLALCLPAEPGGLFAGLGGRSWATPHVPNFSRSSPRSSLRAQTRKRGEGAFLHKTDATLKNVARNITFQAEFFARVSITPAWNDEVDLAEALRPFPDTANICESRNTMESPISPDDTCCPSSPRKCASSCQIALHVLRTPELLLPRGDGKFGVSKMNTCL